MLNKQIIGIISVLVCEILFGFSYLFTKTITDTISPISLLSWRFIFAFIFFSFFVLLGVIKVNFKGKGITKLIALAIFHPTFYFIGETVGINLTTASESGTIIASVPIVTILCSALILKKLPTRYQIAGVTLTVIGVVVIVLAKGLEATFNPIGYLVLFLALISYSLYSVFAEKTVEFTSAEKTYVMIALGAIVFTILAVLENHTHGILQEFLLLPFMNKDFLGAVIYLSLGCSVIALLLGNVAISTIGTNRTASFVGISTSVSVIAGVIILKEGFSFYQGVGTILVLGGVYLANMDLSREKVIKLEKPLKNSLRNP